MLLRGISKHYLSTYIAHQLHDVELKKILALYHLACITPRTWIAFCQDTCFKNTK